MATIGLGFQLSASATQMASGINAGVVELKKLGYAAKQTAADVSTLKTIELSRVFISAIQSTAGAFTSFVSGTAGAVAQVDDLSKRTGVAAEVLQQYQFAAGQSGVNLETFGKAIQKLTVNLGEAQTGNKTAIQSFEDLGLSVEQLSALSPQEAFSLVAEAIGKLPGPAQQAAAAVGIFGKSGVDLVPVFQEGAGWLQTMAAEADRLKLALNNQQVAGLAGLDDTLQKLSATVAAFKARVLSELAPALTKAAEDAATFIANINVQQVAERAADAISKLAAVFSVVAQIAGPISDNIFPAIGAALAIINAQAIAAGISSLVSTFTAAATSAGSYSLAAGTAAVATTALKTAVRGLLVTSGIGVLGLALGFAAEAFINWATASKDSASAVGGDVDGVADSIKTATDQIRTGLAGVGGAGETAADAMRRAAEEATKEASEIQNILNDLQKQSSLVVDVSLQFGQEGFAAGVAYQDAIRRIQAQVESGILNETSAQLAEQDAKKSFDSTIDALKQRAELQKQLAQQEAAIDEQRLRALSSPSVQPLKLEDVRTTSGYSQLLALSRDQQNDPALEESRRQTKELQQIRAKLAALETPPVDIVGA